MAHSKKPLAIALGTAFLASSIAPLASASTNPFGAQQLSSGYDLANYDKPAEGTCGEKKADGSCGEKKADGSCGEKKADGSCGEKKADGSCGEKKADGSCGESKAAEAAKKADGKCGDAKCGADKKGS